jgi:dTDP-4-dehydrorhamnose reductase
LIIGFSPNQEADITFNKILKAVKYQTPVSEDDSWCFQPTWIEQVCEIIGKWLKGEFKDPEPVYPVIPESTTRFKICQELLEAFDIKPTATTDPRYGEDALVGTGSLEKNNLTVYSYAEVRDAILAKLRQV